MKPYLLISTLLFFNMPFSFAQTGKTTYFLSLRQCVQIAVEENINIRTARLEAEKSRHRKAEAISAIIPKVSIGGNFQNNLKLQTVPLSLEMNGVDMSGTVQMGEKFSTAAAATLNWVLYNQTAITAMQLSNKIIELNNLGIEKAGEGLAAAVARLYFLALVTSQQKNLIDENIARTERIQDIVKVLVDNGMAKQVDFDRISINLENLYTQQSNAEAALEQQHNMIKYMLNIPLNARLVLTDDFEMKLLQNPPEITVNFSNHVDIRLLESQQEVNRINRRVINSGYVPSLVFTGQYAVQGQRSEFRNYFNNSPDNVWYNSSYIGLGLSIPVFDGFERRSRSRQARMDYLITEGLLADTKEKFTADYQNAVNNYHNSKMNLMRQEKNIRLAERVYDETALKYREGLATMSALLQDEMSLSAAQANYLNALFSYREAEIEIMSMNSDIRNLSEP